MARQTIAQITEQRDAALRGLEIERARIRELEDQVAVMRTSLIMAASAMGNACSLAGIAVPLNRELRQLGQGQ